MKNKPIRLFNNYYWFDNSERMIGYKEELENVYSVLSLMEEDMKNKMVKVSHAHEIGRCSWGTVTKVFDLINGGFRLRLSKVIHHTDGHQSIAEIDIDRPPPDTEWYMGQEFYTDGRCIDYLVIPYKGGELRTPKMMNMLKGFKTVNNRMIE